MSKQKKSVGCRILDSTVSEIDELAEQNGLSRAEWIERAIMQAMGKRPRHTLASRVAKLEKQVAALAQLG